MMASSFFGMFLGLLIHTCAMHYIGSGNSASNVNEDEEDEEEMV